MPDGRSLTAVETVYVYDSREASEVIKGVAQLEFSDFVVTGDRADNLPEPFNDNIDLVLLPQWEYGRLENWNWYCLTKSKQFWAANTTQVRLSSIVYSNIKVVNILAPGVYILAVSNCGDTNDPRLLSGRVRVRNPSGYLSGIDFRKKGVTLCFAFLYGLIGFFWLSLLCCRRGTVETFQVGLALGLVMCCVICSARWYGYNYCDQYGEVPSSMRAADRINSAKYVAAGTYVLLGVMGWGRLPVIKSWVRVAKLSLLQFAACTSLLYCDDILKFRHYKLASRSFVLSAFVPVSLVGLVLIIWVTRLLTANMRICVRTGNQAGLKFFQRLAVVCAMGPVMTLMAAATHWMDAPQSPKNFWYFHVIAADIVPEGMTLFFFCMLLLIWIPASNVSQFHLMHVEAFPDEDIEKQQPTPQVAGEDEELNCFASGDDAGAKVTQRNNGLHNRTQQAVPDGSEPVPAVIGALE